MEKHLTKSYGSDYNQSTNLSHKIASITTNALVQKSQTGHSGLNSKEVPKYISAANYKQFLLL